MLMDVILENCPEAMMADGFDRAIIGYCHDIVAGCDRIVYDYEKMVRVLIKRDKMTREQAVEFLDFNVLGAYMGKNTPLYINRI
jgi:hypothetical protein